MFAIPDNCKLGNTIYKKLFYDNGDLSTADKELFTGSIDKILWLYCLKPETINIKVYKDDVREYSEIEVIEVTLEKDEKLRRIAEIIMRTIPYPMILVFTLGDKKQIWTAHQRTNQNDSSKNILEELIATDWLAPNNNLFDKLVINKMNMSSLFKLYSDFVNAISIHNAELVGIATQNDNISGEQARAITAQIERLDGQIVSLKAKLKKETQFNRRIEIGLEIKRLENEKQEVL